MADLESLEVWAITSYFNPTNSSRRRGNYQRFRAALPLPLITIELSFNGRFELATRDAENLHQVQSSTWLWHKESLLNLALDRLPACAKYVAWIDCDLIFPTPPAEWRDLLLAELRKHRLVQLFEEVKELGPEESMLSDLSRPEEFQTSGHSISSLISSKKPPHERYQTPGAWIFPRSIFNGMAWACAASLLRQVRFYDAMISGSGDRALMCAALGQFETVRDGLYLTEERMDHYLAWGQCFRELVESDLGYVPAPVLHLWHGDLRHRQHRERHRRLAEIGFDPRLDLERDSAGLWKWKRPRPDLEKFFCAYFYGRNEDGQIR